MYDDPRPENPWIGPDLMWLTPCCVCSLLNPSTAVLACVPAASRPVIYIFYWVDLSLVLWSVNYILHCVLQTHLMVRMDWQPAPDGLAQILQLLKVRGLLLKFTILLSWIIGSGSDRSYHSGSDLKKWTSRAALRLFYFLCSGSVTFWNGCRSGSVNPYLWQTDPDPFFSERALLTKYRYRIKNMLIN